MKTEEIAEKVLTCPNCGSEEFMLPAAAHDFVRVVNGSAQIVRTKAHDGGHDFSELICAECGDETPLNETGDKFDFSASPQN